MNHDFTVEKLNNDFIIHEENETMNIILADDTETIQYQKEIDIILEVLGHPKALTTDLSTFYDFTIDPAYGESEDEMLEIVQQNAATMKEIKALVDDDSIKESDYLIVAAKALHKKLNHL